MNPFVFLRGLSSERGGPAQPRVVPAIPVANLRKSVARGAAWLDVKHPGWFEKIDVGKLDLEYCTTCVLGQLYKNFNAIQAYLDATEPELKMNRNGFSLPSKAWSTKNWSALSECWREAIAQRLEWQAQAKAVETPEPAKVG